MSKYSDKIDSIYENLIEVKVDIASINEHLKTLNGKVLDHRERIESLEEDNTINKIHWAKLIGATGILSTIVAIVTGLVMKSL